MSSSAGDSNSTLQEKLKKLQEELRLRTNEEERLNAEVYRLKGAVKGHDEYGYGIKAEQQDERMRESKQKTQLYEKETPQGTSKSITRTQPLMYRPGVELTDEHGNEKATEVLKPELLQDFAREETILLKEELIEANTAVTQFKSKGDFVPLDVYKEEELELKNEINLEVDVPSNNISLLLGGLRTFPYSGHKLLDIFHSNIISLIGIAKIQQKNFLLLEACSLSEESDETISLDQYLDIQDIYADKLYNFALDIARGLSYLHMKKIAYRDLSLKRVLINGSQAKLEHPVVVRPEEISKEANNFDIWQDIQLFAQLVQESLKRLGKTQKRKNPSAEEILNHLGDSITRRLPTASQQTVFERMSDVVSYLERRLPSEYPKRICQSDSSIEHDSLVPSSSSDRQAHQQLAIDPRRVILTGGSIPELTQIATSHHTPLSIPDMSEYDRSEFEGIELIGREAFSSIFKAFHPSFGYVAVKQYARPYRPDDNEQEIANLLLKHTRHPNIVQTFGIIAHDDLYCGQVMEFMELGDLRTVTRNPQIEYSMKQVYSWSMQIALGLNHIHKMSIMHRDIKPANILLGKSLDDLKISGFGLARPINNSGEPLTMEIGTTIYMAPEMINYNEYSFSIDIYSLSISLWELIHRTAPYEGLLHNSSYTFLKKIANENMRPEIKKSSSLNSLLIRGWDGDPNLRPTISEFLEFASEAYKTADDSDIIRLEDSAAKSLSNRNVWQVDLARKLIGLGIPEHDESEFTKSGLIGYGGFANVHEAYHEKYRHVALKMNRKAFDNIEEDLQEARLHINHSRHPNIVQVLGLLVNVIDGNKRYAGYFMEFMKLGSLFDVIHNPEKEYNMKQVLIWVEKASLGLQYLHNLKVVHRDVKPANFLLGSSLDDLKISDFGLASNIDITQGTGTVFYLAPELMNENNNYSSPSDVYALAISIWEMATRRKPFDHLGEKSLFSMWQYIAEKQERPETVDDSPLNSLLKRGWSEDPGSRPSLSKFIDFAKKESLSADDTNIRKKPMLSSVK